MDFKTLLPDFNALGKTNWAKPVVDTKDVKALLAFAGAALMVVFVFLPWCSASFMGQTGDAYLGIVTWYGILGFLVALAAVVGALYQHYSLTFCAAVLGLVFGLMGMFMVPGVTAEELKFAEAMGIEISHTGAVLYLVASLVAGAGAYLKVANK